MPICSAVSTAGSGRADTFLCTLSDYPEEGYTEDDFFGVTMYWSNYGIHEYREILTGNRILTAGGIDDRSRLPGRDAATNRASSAGAGAKGMLRWRRLVQAVTVACLKHGPGTIGQ